MVKQRIAGNLHFMELNSVVGVGQADRRRVTDEMDLMTARGQLHSQFGCDHTGAAVGWIAGDPNLHVYSSALLVLLLQWRG